MPDPISAYASQQFEFNAATSGGEVISFSFAEAPGKDELVVVSVGAHVQFGASPFATPTFNPTAPDSGDWTLVASHDTDTNGSAGGAHSVYWVLGDGARTVFTILCEWQAGKTADITGAAIHFKNVNPSNPVQDYKDQEYPGSSNNSITGVTTTGYDLAGILHIAELGSVVTTITEPSAHFGSGTLSTTIFQRSDWTVADQYYYQYIRLATIADAGSVGSLDFDYNAFTAPSAVMMQLNWGTAGPSQGSIRTEGEGHWGHVPDFDALDWASQNRVIRWGNVRKKESNSKQGFAGGIDALELADTDGEIWGSTFDAGGTSMLWRNIQINTKWVSGIYGTVAGTTPLALGRVVEFDLSENKVRLGLYDPIEEINNAQFIWDYTPLVASVGGTEFYGTVVFVIGSNIIIEENPDHDLRKNLNTIQNQDINRKSFTPQWERLGNLGVIGTDAIVPGDRIKFSRSNLAATDAGSVLQTEPDYAVSSGSFFVSQDSNHTGTYGTIELQTQPEGVQPGDFIYKRLPLWYRGNPAEIVWQMLHGTNTNLRWNGAITNGTYYGAATKALAQFDYECLITNEGRGAVIESIKQISEGVDAVFFFDRVGSFCWLPWRPRMRDDADFVSERYYGTVTGGTEGTIGNMWNASWRTNSDTIFTDYTVFYDFNHYEDDDAIDYRSQFTRQNLNTATYHRGFRNVGTLYSKWCKNTDEAIIMAERKLRAATVARAKYSFDTTLFGVETDIYQLLRLSHRTGSLRQRAFAVTESNFDLDNDLISIGLRDITDVYFGAGYGYGEDSALSSHAVSGTSRCGWGWVTAGSANIISSGTIGTGYTIGSTGSRVQLWDRAGVAANIGTDAGADTRWITIGSEVLKIAGSVAASTYSIETRGAQLSDTGSHDAGEEAWIALPQDSNGDLIFLYNGTEFSGTGPHGTAHNISVGTWGTVWRLW